MQTINATLVQAASTEQPAFTLHSANAFVVDAALLQVNKMRKTAAENHQRYDVMGRNAAIGLMSDVYAMWVKVNQAGKEDLDKFNANIKQKLTDLAIEFRKTSTAAGLLIRYVFADASDKQVHVYGRALDVAYAKQTPAAGFEQLVRGTEGGFEGLRAESVSGGNTGSDRAAVAYSSCVNEPTFETVEMRWKDGEKYRVFIAVRNEDDTADMKDAGLDEDRCKGVLLNYLAAKKTRQAAADAKPKTPSKAEKAVIASLNAAIAEQEIKAKQLSIELVVAQRNSDAAKVRELDVAIQVANATLGALQTSLGQLTPKA